MSLPNPIQGDLIPSDEEDEDYKPENDEPQSPTSSVDDGFTVQDEATRQAEDKDQGLSKEELDEAWRLLNEPQKHAAPPPEKSRADDSHPPPSKRIKITRVYEYAKKEFVEEVEVDRDSEEAKDWLLKNSTSDSTNKTKANENTPTAGSKQKDASTSIMANQPATSSSTHTATTPAKQPTSQTHRRKPRASLASLNASLNKPKKLNTLEKSKLDWQKYVDKNQLKDDMVQNRKAGYLEKQDFLQRTQDRQEESLEGLKQNPKRR